MPSKKIQSLGADAIKNMYSDEEIPDPLRKLAANVVYGLATKKNNNKQFGTAYLEKDDAVLDSQNVLEIPMKNDKIGYIAVKKR